jgi:hypothetical protein
MGYYIREDASPIDTEVAFYNGCGSIFRYAGWRLDDRLYLVASAQNMGSAFDGEFAYDFMFSFFDGKNYRPICSFRSMPPLYIIQAIFNCTKNPRELNNLAFFLFKNMKVVHNPYAERLFLAAASYGDFEACINLSEYYRANGRSKEDVNYWRRKAFDCKTNGAFPRIDFQVADWPLVDDIPYFDSHKILIK